MDAGHAQPAQAVKVAWGAVARHPRGFAVFVCGGGVWCVYVSLCADAVLTLG